MSYAVRALLELDDVATITRRYFRTMWNEPGCAIQDARAAESCGMSLSVSSLLLLGLSTAGLGGTCLCISTTQFAPIGELALTDPIYIQGWENFPVLTIPCYPGKRTSSFRGIWDFLKAGMMENRLDGTFRNRTRMLNDICLSGRWQSPGT